MHYGCTLPETGAKLECKGTVSANQPSENCCILNMHNNEHPLRSNTKGYGCKTH